MADIVRLPSQEKPWMKYFPEAAQSAKMPECSIYEYAKMKCEQYGREKALYYYGTSVTYAELLNKIDACADAYGAIGVKKDEIVSVMSVTLPEIIYSMYGLNKLGAASNYIDPRMDIARIRDSINNVNSKILITIDLAWPKVERILPEIPKVEKIIVVSANDSLPCVKRIVRSIKTRVRIPYSNDVMQWKVFYDKGKDYHADPCQSKKDDLAIITYTGGTTGTPKGVMLKNESLNTVAESFALSGVDYSIGQRFLDIMPVFAAYGTGCGIHLPLVMGLENVIIPKFTPETLGKLIKQYHPGHMMGVPAFYEKIMQSGDLNNVDLSFLLTTGCGGDTMNEGMEERFNSFLKEHHAKYCLSQGYGMSEVAGAASCCFSNITRQGSSGLPLVGVTISIFHRETGEELGYNQLGEVCLTGPSMMKGYFNDPEETAHVMRKHKDGKVWIHSGDIGYMDEDGFIYLKGRIKHMITRFDGHKVFPVQIETVISRHHAVGACAVVGIPDKDHAQGMVPLGIVELKTENSGKEEAIRQEIIKMCDELLEERGKPVDIVIVGEMSHTALSKNDVQTLTERYADYKY